MRHILRNLILIAVVLGLLSWAIVPPEENLRLGKDLAGGVSLTYSVQIAPGDDADAVLDQTIQVLKQRVDPNGQLDITMIARGRDQIEITMPLPSERVSELRENFEQAMQALEAQNISEDLFDSVMQLPLSEARAQFDVWGWVEGTPNRDLATDAFEAYQRIGISEGLLPGIIEQFGEGSPQYIEGLNQIVGNEVRYARVRNQLFAGIADPEEVRQILQLPDEETVKIDSDTGESFTIESPRTRAWEEFLAEHEGQVLELTLAREAWDAYEAERRALDDPQDLVRLLRGAGVLTFRITAAPGEHPEEARLRSELRENGPRAVQSADAGWYRINQIESWFDTTGELEFLQENPAAYFNGRGYVVEEYGGSYYMLAWDTRGLRLTPAEGDWGITNAFVGVDRLGRPAINFTMNPRGAARLGTLTEANVGNRMAVLLDDQVYTAPTLQSRIATSGQITGDFSESERRYVINVLNAGSLRARLSPEPINLSTIAPDLGADNLRSGLQAGYWAIGAVSIFMILYYFTSGLVACITLVSSAVVILGAMSLNRAAFTLPGIAGVVLTFGMAVDANVLIYERIREELRSGKDIKPAVRAGFDKALSSIIDGNVTNLIVCVVLAYTGTQEIRGFAITLGIGVAATLFSALVIARTLFGVLIEWLGMKDVKSLPRAIPAIGRLLEPSIDWMKFQYVFIVISTIAVGTGLFLAATRGDRILDNEFLGGTQVTLRFADETTGEPIYLDRSTVEDRVHAIGETAEEGNDLQELRQADVLVLSPQPDGITSDTFLVKTTATNEQVVLNSLQTEFDPELASPPPLTFTGVDIEDPAFAPVFPIDRADADNTLGDLIGRTGVQSDVSEFLGGVAVVIENIDPPVDFASLRQRLEDMTRQQDFRDLASRKRDVLLLEGTPDAVEAVVVVALDGAVTYFDSTDRFEREVVATEWELVRESFRRSPTPASVQTFSPAIASTFQAQAIVAVVISFLCILIYIWVRFGSVRYSAAAIITLCHDVLAAIGLIALAEILYDIAPEFCQSIGIMPFRIDLSLVAALLTIIGYSLNDTIIIMDRIRENRGKLDYASRKVVNDSINQTISRTVITSGTTFIATLILYIFGGEGVRAFSYALLCGIVIGTYSSIAVAAPLVWSSKRDRSHNRPEKARPGEATIATA